MSVIGAASSPLRAAPGQPRRVANRCAVRARAAWMAGLVLAVAGCGGQASVALPHRSGAPAVPAIVADPPLTVRQQVIAAYTGYWQALGQAVDTQNAARARAILAQYVPAASIP